MKDARSRTGCAGVERRAWRTGDRRRDGARVGRSLRAGLAAPWKFVSRFRGSSRNGLPPSRFAPLAIPALCDKRAPGLGGEQDEPGIALGGRVSRVVVGWP